MNYCEYCGKQFTDGAISCTGCGAHVEKKNNEKLIKTGKYCIHCGNQILPEAVVCPKCGCEVTKNKKNISDADKCRTLQLATKVFMLIALGSCVVNGFGSLLVSGVSIIDFGYLKFSHFAFTSFIPLIWIIPMTLHYFRATKNNQPVSTGFKVCTLIFVNFIAGILMFCESNLKNLQK